jgi:hypothetical protein
MSTIRDLIEDWIEMRAMLKRHLEVLEFDATTSAASASTEAAIVMIKSCITELNALLKEYSRSP